MTIDPKSGLGMRKSLKLVRTLAFSACAAVAVGYFPAYAQLDETATIEDSQGEALYATHCAACHGAEGQGGAAQSLVDSRLVANDNGFIYQILFGGGFMPAMMRTLTDEEIAEIVNYVRTAWHEDEDLPDVTPEAVTALRP